MMLGGSYFTDALELKPSSGAGSRLLFHSPDGPRFSKDQFLGASGKYGSFCANSGQCSKLVCLKPTMSFTFDGAFLFF